MSKINGHHQAWHPVEHLAFWKTDAAELRVQADRYDALTQGDPVLKKQLDDLLSWAREEALTDEAYHAGEC